MLHIIKRQLDGLLSLAYPDYCSACGEALLQHERNVCGICRNNLPKTHFHTYSDNPASKLFWGKVLIRTAASYYYFQKGDKVQKLIHQLKYKGEKEIGETVGIWYGEELKESTMFQDLDLIIPVPLHPEKLVRRGYNQAEWFGRGLSKSLNVELDCRSLERIKFTETQTRRSMFDRYQNIEDVFSFRRMEESRRHILIVDDVLTTGSTLISCIDSIRKEHGSELSISVATMAIAKH
ncbi:MAG: ComF family protein [Bacteroidia bacterium]|nr:ComF family protein [Bacteroidia bacterium]